MAGNSRGPEQVRREIEAERLELVGAVESLKSDFGANLRAKLPVLAAGALGVGFVLAGGIGAGMRLLARRGREGQTKARFGRFSVVNRD
jgi:hypothetical protein